VGHVLVPHRPDRHLAHLVPRPANVALLRAAHHARWLRCRRSQWRCHSFPPPPCQRTRWTTLATGTSPVAALLTLSPRYRPPMRIVVAPDKFAGTLSAVEAASAIAEGWARRAPGDVLEQVPMSDGGPGFVDVLHTAL